MRSKFQFLLGALTGVLALSLAECGSSTVTLSDNGYKNTCSAPTDCAPVFFGNVCGCACANAAINQSYLARYQADFDAAHAGCTPSACQADCVASTATCAAGGVCALK